jgi:hypothetical protein
MDAAAGADCLVLAAVAAGLDHQRKENTIPQTATRRRV